jgi:hypothetical protein
MHDSSHDPFIESGRYRAEVLRGGTIERFWYYVIRRKDSNEVLDLAKFESCEEAMEAARKALARMNVETVAS